MEGESRRPRRVKRRFGAIFWCLVSLLGTALIATPSSGIMPLRLLYNSSESAPPGWYLVAELDVICRGDLVVASLPDMASHLASERGYLPPGIPVIKTVASLPGDTICETGARLQINGKASVPVFPVDKAGRPLPSPWKTCQTLEANEILLLSDRTPDSFDGRYFGAVPRPAILGRAVKIGGFRHQKTRRENEGIGLRSECKIKAHGANDTSSPCLHIDFYGSIPDGIAPPSERTLNEDDRIGRFHSGELVCFPPEQPE